MLADEYYVNDISNKVRDTIEINIKNCKYVAHRVTFGKIICIISIRR